MNVFKTPEGYLYSNKALLYLFIPLLVEYALEFFVGLADSIMVASLGEAAISGVSLVDFLMQLLIFSFSALATGGAVVAGQYLGDNQLEKAQNSATQLVWFSTIASAALMILVLVLRQFLIGILFGQIEAAVWHNAEVYLYIVALSIPFIAIYNAGAAIFRTTNDASLPMKIMLLCDVLNVLGNAFCIYYLGWDVTGVAVPTVISRVAAALLILYFAIDEDYKLHIKRTLKHKFDFYVLRKVLKVGIPYGIENGLFQLGRVLVLSLVSTFGTMAIAANSVGYAIGIFSVLPGFAINLGLTAVISRCVGANDYEQAKYYNKKCLVIVFISHVLINIAIFALLPIILNIYDLSAQTAAMTTEMVIWHGIFAIIIWPLSFTLPATFRGAGDSKSVMYISLAVMFTCRILLSYVIADWMGIGVFGTWIAMFIDWYVRAGIYIYRYFSNKWTEYRVV
ncbi:MAG: MATE family efflux transporter [Methanobrevibacter sp.]|uniref:MATE family efflux transporter n=1 Tax=Methanobrevibacter sp. TaxID=66852 RepID=UPI002E7A6EAD|nr:MATE family efflux transporter [Methanobrevibacter sp.]MEE0935978.1 MATE family efflux transporter [Methanobrevibacter sp.]